MDVCGLGVLCCLRRYQGHTKPRELPSVCLDTSNMGNEVVIVKMGRRICGAGAALATAPILQNKGYFETKLQSMGIWSVGLATRRCDTNKPLGTSPDSWVLKSDGNICHNGLVRYKLDLTIEEGDIVGCTYDHVEMNFYLNGKPLHCPVTGIKGTVYPVLYVDDGTILDVNFTEFVYNPPEGFEKIMFEKSLL